MTFSFTLSSWFAKARVLWTWSTILQTEWSFLWHGDEIAIPEYSRIYSYSGIGSIERTLRGIDRNKWRAVCLSNNCNNFTISDSISLKLSHFSRNLSRNNMHVNNVDVISVSFAQCYLYSTLPFGKKKLLFKFKRNLSAPFYVRKKQFYLKGSVQ